MSLVIVIGLGSSMGPRERTLRLAVAALAALPGLELLATSRLWRSRPVGGVARGAFVNAAVAVRWVGEPLALLRACQRIEARLGRRRGLRWADRPIDLDLLWAPGLVLREQGLTLPHPRLRERPFALVPLLEVQPEACDPETGRSLGPLAGGRKSELWPVGVLSRSLRARAERCIGEPLPSPLSARGPV